MSRLRNGVTHPTLQKYLAYLKKKKRSGTVVLQESDQSYELRGGLTRLRLKYFPQVLREYRCSRIHLRQVSVETAV